jgi:hypothetical protein
MKFTLPIFRVRFVCATLGVCMIALLASRPWKAAAQVPAAQVQEAQVQLEAAALTPGMLFGPLSLTDGQHIELCASYLSEGTITATIHFRNITTGEKTAGQSVTMPSGGGGCVVYRGKGQVIGMARGDGAASDWVSPSNALISSMSVVDDNPPFGFGFGFGARDNRGSIRAVVLGVPKMWVVGL